MMSHVSPIVIIPVVRTVPACLFSNRRAPSAQLGGQADAVSALRKEDDENFFLRKGCVDLLESTLYVALDIRKWVL